MRISTLFVLSIWAVFCSGQNFEQKHSFGFGINQGHHTFPTLRPNTATNSHRELSSYSLGIHLNHTKLQTPWLMLRTTLNDHFAFPGDYPERNARLGMLWGDLSFAPLLVYLREDYAFYGGFSVDLTISWKVFIHNTSGNFRFADENAYLVVTPHIGFWQRLGSSKSPWFLDVSISRRNFNALMYSLDSNFGRTDIIHWNLTTGLRYTL